MEKSKKQKLPEEGIQQIVGPNPRVAHSEEASDLQGEAWRGYQYKNADKDSSSSSMENRVLVGIKERVTVYSAQIPRFPSRH